ncbi:MAG: protein translocase subunit SecF [Pseudobdellovibrionaceae bacterium]
MNMTTTKNKNDFGRFDFVARIGLFGGISLVLTILSLLYLMINGINYGIDFRGGTEIQVKFQEKVTISELRTTMEKLAVGDFGVQGFGDVSEFIIRFQTENKGTEKETNAFLLQKISKIKTALSTEYSAQKPEIVREDTVGPQVGAELKRNSFLAVFYALLVILIYVSIRFDYKYAPGAVVCLFHDAIITLAIFNLVGKDVNVPVLAAIMSLLGYSLNDTIVVFDRIRETENEYKDRGSKFIINKAINDMLGRTFKTSGTVLISAASLWAFAGGTVGDIAFAITVGIIFGTYSSIYVAAPLILAMENVNLIPKPHPKTA